MAEKHLLTLAGGILIGGASLLASAATGKIPGISGVFARLILLKPGDTAWRLAFLAGLVAGAGAIFAAFHQAAGLGETPRRHEKNATPEGKGRRTRKRLVRTRETGARDSRAAHRSGETCGSAIGRARLWDWGRPNTWASWLVLVRYRAVLALCLRVFPLFAMGSQFGMCQDPLSRTQPPSAGFFQIGQMREAIGQGQSGGRIRLGDVAEREHFFGVGAVAALGGEVTVEDSAIRATRVGADGRPEAIPGDPSKIAATFLFGASVADWLRFPLDDAVSADDVDATIESHVSRAGVDAVEPTVFRVAGTFRDVRVHVINGACPLHARRAGMTLDERQKPFEATYESISGTIVGVYAKGKAGVLTHPGTSTHMHLIYVEPRTGATVTAHVEQIGFGPGCVLMLPKR